MIKDTHEADVSVVLKYVMIKVGLRAQNFPSKEEKAVIVDHIYQNYPGNTIGELRLAFDMAIVGDLNLKQEDAKCYENFSCAYISTIMNAYLEWAKEEFKQTVKEEPPPMKILNDFELDNLRRQWTEEFYQRLKAGAVENIPQYCQEILSKDGFIGEGETIVGFFVRVLGEKRKALYEKA